MPWKNQGGGGGPWGGGQGPWGGGGGGSRPPDLEDILRKSQDRVKRLLPGGFGSGRSLLFIALIGLALWLATGFYRVNPDEQGVALIFGKVWKLTNPGLNYNLPPPIGEVLTPKVTRVNRVEVGVRSGNDSNGSPVTQDVPEESLMLTGDENIIDIQFVVFWVIKDPIKFLFAIRDPEDTVKNAAESAMRQIVGQTEFEYARTQGRNKIEQDARKLIQQLLDSYQSGIEVSQVELQKVDPPGAAIEAFRDVQAARADKERAVNEAQAYFNEVTQRAEGQAQKLIKEGEAYKEQTVAIANGDAQRFDSVLTQYQKAKDITRRRMYLETMEEVLKKVDKVLIDSKLSGGAVPYLSLNELLKKNQPAKPSAGGSDGNQ
ncbi:MAG: modulator of FtsH protease HflK [Rhodospirillaceae bacterium]|jgi:membrane protease subunit HflK|nr:modulator of FtsH protease HflK [Rhodospirillaceae bacterium]